MKITDLTHPLNPILHRNLYSNDAINEKNELSFEEYFILIIVFIICFLFIKMIGKYAASKDDIK